jgi:WD40-like Beta Propeller Repeat
MITRTWKRSLLVLWLSAAGCATAPPGAEREARPADLEALKTVGGKANGLLVWASSRSGVSHIYTMKTDGTGAKAITSGDNVDWYPRFSPDGSKILFVRSQDEEFVREHDASNSELWDLYTINPDGTEISKVVENATWGSWAGPDQIVFLRGSKIMRTKVGAEEEIKVMDTARHSFFQGAVIMQPELSRDGHSLVLSLGGTHHQTGIWSLKKKTWTQIGSGSQAAFSPDGASVFWVSPSGKALSEIVRHSLSEDTAKAQANVNNEEAGTEESGDNAESGEDKGPTRQLSLIDMPGKRSREAFPRMSNDGKWLVFGAGIKGLEHDLEDFEIYLWEIGTPAQSAARLTFHSANDRWPDIFVGEPAKAAQPPQPALKKAPEDGSGEAAKPSGDDGQTANKPDTGNAEKTDKGEKVEEAGTGDEPPTEADTAPPFDGKAKGKKAVKKKRR